MNPRVKKLALGSLLALAVLITVSGLGFATHSSLAAVPSGSQVNGASGDRPNGAGAPAIAPGTSLAQAQAQAGNGTGPGTSAIYRGVSTAVKFDVSPPLRSIAPILPGTGKIRENEDRDNPPIKKPGGPITPDTVVQKLIGAFAIPTPIISFDGPPNLCGCSPPDPNGEVGPNHYVVMDNLHFQIFNKTGTSLFGPAANNTLWSGFGGACQTENSGDPVILYDQLANRWLLSQFTAAGPTYYNCLALSTSPDPLGTYYRWAFTTGTNFPDYPKYGMWPDAYYISTREFAGGSSFAGVGAYAGNRVQMLAGNPSPQVISFLAPPTPMYNVGDGLLPTDLDGTTPPPVGSPNYYVGSMDNNGSYGAPQDALTLWKFHADFESPPNSSFILANTIPTAPFNSAFPCSGRNCIPQPGTTNKLDILSYRQRPIFRLAYRNMGGFESLLTNQSVDAGAGPGGEIAGVRWYELRSPNTSPVIFQQGTYAPGLTDGIHRWMGSLAMDRSGDIALGYSVSSGTVFPGIRYTGRLPSDPPGEMPQGEATIVDGTGSQTGSQRWGDYTDMTVDPTDDCTFWYVNEYVPTTSAIGWRLRIGSFKFPSCGGTPTPTLTPCPTCATSTRTPTVTVTTSPTITRTPTCAPGYGYTTATGTVVAGTDDTGNHTDDGVTNINLPFSFTLYGASYTTANVSSNGNLQFVTSSTAYVNECLPSTMIAGPAIFPFWEDLRTDGTSCTPGPCGIYTSTSGSAPNRIFNIEWRATYFTGTGSANFEIRLYEGAPSRFDIVIGSITGSNTGATVGVQDGAGSFTQFACNTAVTNNLRIAFTLQACGTPGTATPTPAVTGSATRSATRTSTPGCGTPSAWVTASPVPTARGRAAGATMGNNVYLFGGRPSNTTYEQTVYRYDTAAGTWTLLTATLPDAMSSNMAAGVLTFPEGQRAFIAGGSGTGSAVTGRTLAFNPADGTFTAKATWPASPARIPGGWAVYNNKFYVFGGFNPLPAPGTMYAEIWQYDPMTNAWTQVSTQLSMARGYIATEMMPDGLIYLAGGSQIDSAGQLTDEMTFEKFNPATGAITTGPAMPEPKSNNQGYNVGGEFYVPTGGYLAANHDTNMLIYNAASNTWRMGATTVNAARNYAKGYGADGSIYAIGGLDPGATAFYNYNQKLAPGGSCGTSTVTPVRTMTMTPVRTNTMTPVRTGTGTPIRTNTNTPIRTVTPGRTITPCGGCNIQMLAVVTSCYADGTVHWIAIVHNPDRCGLNAPWRAELQVRTNSGSFRTVRIQFATSYFGSGDVVMDGFFCYHFSSNVRDVRVEYLFEDQEHASKGSTERVQERVAPANSYSTTPDSGIPVTTTNKNSSDSPATCDADMASYPMAPCEQGDGCSPLPTPLPTGVATRAPVIPSK